MSDRIEGWVVWALVVGWVLTGLVGTLGVAALLYGDDLWCEHATGDSDFGEASWSWWPVGLECTWSEAEGNLVTDHQEPTWGPTAITVVYVGAGITLARWARDRRRHRTTAPSPEIGSGNA